MYNTYVLYDKEIIVPMFFSFITTPGRCTYFSFVIF